MFSLFSHILSTVSCLSSNISLFFSSRLPSSLFPRFLQVIKCPFLEEIALNTHELVLIHMVPSFYYDCVTWILFRLDTGWTQREEHVLIFWFNMCEDLRCMLLLLLLHIIICFWLFWFVNLPFFWGDYFGIIVGFFYITLVHKFLNFILHDERIQTYPF